MFFINYFESLKKNKILLNFFIILSFILLSIFSVILLLKNNVLYLGFDMQFHFRRIIELKESLMNGNIFPNFSFNEFHGSGVMTLYPYYNLFPAVLLSFIFKSKITLLYVFVSFNVMLTFFVSFYSSKNYTKSYRISYIFSIIYSMSSIFLFYNIISSDFGIVSSYEFLPLIIFGLLNFIQSEDNWMQLSIGMSLILYGHILNFIIISILIFILLIININNFDKNMINNLLKAIILFLFITSIFWLPFLYFYAINLNNINMPVTYQLNRIGIKDFISGLYGSKTNNTIGFFPLIGLFVSPFFYKKFNIYEKQLYILSIIIIIFVLFLPWRIITSYSILKLLNIFQFTSRLLIIPLILLSFIFSIIISKYMKSFNYKNIIYFLAIFIVIALQFVGQFTTINNFSKNPSINNYIHKDNLNINIAKFFNYPINTSREMNILMNNYYLSDDDYIPKSSIHMSTYINRNIGFYNNYHNIIIKHTGYNTFSFVNNDNINKLSLPIYAYNKQNIQVYLNGKKVNHYSNKNGLLTINNIHNDIKSYNKVYIKNDLNPFKFIGSILSSLGWLFIFITFIKNKFFKFD